MAQAKHNVLMKHYKEQDMTLPIEEHVTASGDPEQVAAYPSTPRSP